MAKFCTRCGRPLEEGKVCECQANAVMTGGVVVNQAVMPTMTTTTQPAMGAQPVAAKQTAGIDFNKILNDFLDIVKGMFVKPSDTMKKYATSSNFGLGLGAIVLNCLLTGFLTYCLLSKLLDSAMGLLGLGDYSSLLTGSIDIPFMPLFLHGFIYMAVFFAIMALGIYVMANPIFKDKMDIKQAFALVGVCSVFTIITTVVCLILTYMSIKVAIVVILVAATFYLVHLYQGLNDITTIDKNKIAYTFMPVFVVACFVVLYILPKIY